MRFNLNFITLIKIFAIASLISCSDQPNTKLPIYPSTLEGKKSTELGKFIKDLMPQKNTYISWDWLSEDQRLVWMDDGYISVDNVLVRRALLRINVMGDVSTFLIKSKNELTWLLKYSTKNNPKFGPALIELQPGLENDNQCFGSLYEGCSFEILPSLANAGISAQEVCSPTDSLAGDRSKIYLLNAGEKKPTYMRYDHSCGSGGCSSYISILTTALLSDACK
jgi:hypothetical protein